MNQSRRETMHIAGKWKVKLHGIAGSEGGDQLREVVLPGTLDENRIGSICTEVSLEYLSREFTYEGPAYYESSWEIPDHWAGKRIMLLLERSRETELWVDGIWIGRQNSLITAQMYDVTAAALPGKRIFTIKVNNAEGVMAWDAVRNSHIATEHTQTNWNGIVGRMELQATDPVWIDDLQVFPDVDKSHVTVTLKVNKSLDKVVYGKLRFAYRNEGLTNCILEHSYHMESNESQCIIRVVLDYEAAAKLWDESQPFLHRIDAVLEAETGSNKYEDEVSVSFGFRNFQTKGSGFQMNGKPAFLRGKHDAAVFPLTGYAPMEVTEWQRIFTIAKSYGINHYRFHSWCPPEAAFQAADEIGMYLQPELPLWDPSSAFNDDEEWSYYRQEAIGMLKAYGNHPSFIMFAWGNELGGSCQRMEELVEECRQLDGRRLYAIGSNNFFATAGVPSNSDYWSTFWTEGTWNFKKPEYGGKHVRGSTPHPTRGHINNSPPSTLHDYRKAIEHVEIPIIGHEVGQYQIHPDFTELIKYTGVLKPRNLEAYRQMLQDRELLDKAAIYKQASGQLALLCYREEIEAALRTPHFGGFQLLDLQDFPGQGTALVGVLDVFMESKGLIEPAKWREFCCETVPLLRMKKYVWTSDETFGAMVELAHYGSSEMPGSVLTWTIRNETEDGELAFGSLPISKSSDTGVWNIGTIATELNKINKPEKLVVELHVQGTSYRNRYPLWVYPEFVDIDIPPSVVLTRQLDESTLSLLQAGGNALLMPELDELEGAIPGAFIPDFWCYSMFKKYGAPGTLGTYCDPHHPALKHFPTEFHANWQWWHLMKNARAMNLSSLPSTIEPIVGVIDNILRQFKLGYIFEARLGTGKLLVCSIDLLKQLDRPEARQLLHSLLNYMATSDFKPTVEVSAKQMNSLFHPHDPLGSIDRVAPNQDADRFG